MVFPGLFEREKASYDADTGQLFGECAMPSDVYSAGYQWDDSLPQEQMLGDLRMTNQKSSLLALRSAAGSDAKPERCGLCSEQVAPIAWQ